MKQRWPTGRTRAAQGAVVVGPAGTHASDSRSRAENSANAPSLLLPRKSLGMCVPIVSVDRLLQRA